MLGSGLGVEARATPLGSGPELECTASEGDGCVSLSCQMSACLSLPLALEELCSMPPSPHW